LSKDKFPPQDLGYMLSTPAWNGAFSEGHTVHKLLTSLPNCTNEEVSYSALMALCVLWSTGTVA